MKSILVIGSTCVDILIHIDHLPKTAENLHPTSQTMTVGGCAYNVSQILNLTATEHTFISPVGGGMYGNFVYGQLTANGLPVSVHIPDQENGCCYCFIEADGERTFLSYHGVEYSFQKEWMLPYKNMNFDMTYICGLELEEATGISMIEYLEESLTGTLFFAPGPRGIRIHPDKMNRIMKLHPVLHINETEAQELGQNNDIPAAARNIQKCSGNTVIITLGERGTYCLEKNGTEYTIPTTPVKVVDTVGAGDSHIGAVLSHLAKGFTLKDAIIYGNKVSGLVVSTSGATPDIERIRSIV